MLLVDFFEFYLKLCGPNFTFSKLVQGLAKVMA